MYAVIFSNDAKKQLKKLPKAEQLRVFNKISALATEPRPNGVSALQGRLSNFFRLRSGKYRVIYGVEDDQLVVLIVKIAHRKHAYK